MVISKMLEKLYIRATNDLGYLTQSYAKYMQIDCIFIGCLMIPHYFLVYTCFWMFYRPLVESGKNPQKYIKYGAEDLERMLGEFFEGKNLNEPKR